MKWLPHAAACWIGGLAAALNGWEREGLLCAAAVLLAVCGRQLIRKAWLQSFLCLFLFGLSCLYGQWWHERNVSRLPEAGSMLLSGVLASHPDVDGDKARFVLREANGEKIAVTVRLASKEELSTAAGWRRGDEAVLSGEIALPGRARNFGQFDYADFLKKRGIHRVFRVDGAMSLNITRPTEWSPEKALGWIESVRQIIGRRIAGLFPGRQAGFMQGMLIGLDEGMDGELFDEFSRLGLTHVIAISGLHVAVVVGAWIGFLRLFRVTRETALASAQAVIPIYVLLSGCAPSAVRAGIMAMLGIFIYRRGRIRDGMALVALAAVGMTAVNPAYLHDIGFQLSFIVTAGLIAGTPVLVRLVPETWPKWLSGSIAVTLTAQLVSFPLTIHYFNQYSLLSAFANFALVPMFGFLVLPAGYLALFVSLFSEKVALWLAKLPGLLNELGFRLAGIASDFQMAATVWPSPPTGAILLYYLLLAGVTRGLDIWKHATDGLFPLRERGGKRLALLGTCGLALWGFAVYGSADWASRGTVSFLDVGQGDAILIRTPEGRTILVDGGGTVRHVQKGEEWRLGRDPYEVGKDLLVPLLMKRGVRQIDWMIVTHGDADHAGGLAAVMERLPIRALVFNGTLSPSPAFDRLVRLAIEKDVPLMPAGLGQFLEVDRHTRLEFLFPVPADGLRYEENQNGSSVVFLMSMYGERFLFTGDMDAAAERETIRLLRESGNAFLQNNSLSAGIGGEAVRMVTGGGELPLAVMKIAHHGSKTSTSELWLNRWKPRMAVISVGEGNMYRHPSREVLDRLDRHQIPVLRTDLHGEIRMKVRPDGTLWRTFFPVGEGAPSVDDG